MDEGKSKELVIGVVTRDGQTTGRAGIRGDKNLTELNEGQDPDDRTKTLAEVLAEKLRKKRESGASQT